MSATLLDGKAFATNLRQRIATQVRALKEAHQVTPGLAVVIAGDDAASHVYVRNKARQTAEAGMHSVERRLPATVTAESLLAEVHRLNEDQAVHGILVQLPLPAHVDSAVVLDAISPDKDVDGFHALNTGRLASGMENATVPCTPLGCLMLLRAHLGDMKGLNALVLGRSNIVGKPMAQLLLAEHCTVTIAHSRTRDLPEACRRADILVAAVGRAEMVKGDWVKPGATVIDVGINRVPAGNGGDKAGGGGGATGAGGAKSGKMRLVGDVDFAEVVPVAGAITPVPGGVGPMTIACLLHNTLQLACRQHGVAVPAV